MRVLTEHVVNPANDKLRIEVTDKPAGAGGANHRYVVTGFDASKNASNSGNDDTSRFVVLFQNGPIPEHGVNGLTQEALLAIVADRLRSFQAGPFACPENADALTHVVEAMEALKSRTKARMARGVEAHISAECISNSGGENEKVDTGNTANPGHAIQAANEAA